MPGFLIGGSGTMEGKSDPGGRSETKRKYRWIFRIIEDNNTSLQEDRFLYLQSAARPNFGTGELAQHHNQENIWHQGKTTWEPIELTFYDGETPYNISGDIYRWLLRSSNIIPNATVYHPQDYKKDCELRMMDSFGGTTERWIVYNAWPKSVNWNDLNYEDDALAMVNVTLRYDRAHMDIGAESAFGSGI